MQPIRHFIHQFDMFAAAPTLRAHGQPQLANVCGGLLSIALLCFFAYVLTDMTIKIMNFDDIESQQRIQSNIQQTKTQNIDIFALQIQGFNAIDTIPFIIPVAQKITMNKSQFLNSTPYQLEPCNNSQWQDLKQNYEASIKIYDFPNMFCLKQGQKIELINKQSQGIQDMLLIDLYPCYVFGGEICASKQQIDEFVEAHIQRSLYFVANYYFIDTVFNPTIQNAVIRRVSQVRATFTTTRGSESILHLDHYKVETDTSITPAQQKKIQQGWIFGNQQQTAFQIVPFFHYVRLVVLLSSQTKVIERIRGKFDDALSYVGGLFGIIIGFIGFFIMSFNQYRYELMAGQSAFNYNSQGQKFRETDFHFLYYLHYSCYDWINTLFCCELGDWRKCKVIDETREQANQQLDVNYLFKRLQYFQRVTQYLLTNQQKMALYLTQPPSLEDVTKSRKCTEYYDKVIRGKSALTLQDIEVINNVMQFGLSLAQGGQPSTKRIALRQNNKNKIGFPKQAEKSRQNILDLALDNFPDDTKITQVEQRYGQDQQFTQLQKQMAEAVFTMPTQIRARIQQKIPLKIMKRLKFVYQKIHQSEQVEINLII